MWDSYGDLYVQSTLKVLKKLVKTFSLFASIISLYCQGVGGKGAKETTIDNDQCMTNVAASDQCMTNVAANDQCMTNVAAFKKVTKSELFLG